MEKKSYLKKRNTLKKIKTLSCWVSRKETKKKGVYSGEFFPPIVSPIVGMKQLVINDDKTQINIHLKQSHCVVISYA